MGKKQTYVITQDFKTPYVVSSHNPRNPTETRWAAFKKGEMISGEMIFDNNKPNFVLYNGSCVVPLSVIKKVVTKEIISNANGKGNVPFETTKNISKIENPKVRYMDAMLFGAVIGIGAVWLANKQNWIQNPDNKNYLYGAGVGAGLFAYFVFRKNNQPKIKTI
jgi:hypothetical protein